MATNARYTERAQEAIQRAIAHAQNNGNPNIQPEHLLKAILETESVLNKILEKKEVEKLADVVAQVILRLPRMQPAAEPRMSLEFVKVLQESTNMAIGGSKGGEYVTVPHLVLGLLSNEAIGRVFSEGVKRLGKGEIVKAVEKEVEEAGPSSSPQSDDPEGGAGKKMSKFAVEMVEQARKNRYDPVIGRDDEMRQVLEVLSKKGKSNVILVGKPGVGKTAIVKGIAQQIAKEELSTLIGYKIYNVDVGAMVAGTCHRGDFEERLKGLVQEAEKDPQVILFIDEIHVVLGAGKTDGSLDAANILKPGLADGTLRVIGATTYDEYRNYVTKDPAFERRFTKIDVREPSIEDTITILRGLRERLEMHHGVKVTDKALVFAANMGKRYIPGRRLPDLAIDLVDTACSAAIISIHSEPQEIARIKGKIGRFELERTSIEVDLEHVKSGGSDDTEETKRVKVQLEESLFAVTEKIKALNAKLEELRRVHEKGRTHLVKAREVKQKLDVAKARLEQAYRDGNRHLVFDLQTNVIPIYERELEECNKRVEAIGPEHIAKIISRWTGIPTNKVSMKETEKLLTLDSFIKRRIFGQDTAVDTVVKVIRANRAGLSPPNRPIGSFLFVGPTGVGKTELAKSLATELLGSPDSMLVLDMSDYANEISLNKLIGAPPGYVGYGAGGALTEPVKERPFNVVLLDEVDHAHQTVLNVLYQLLDEGRVTDSRDECVNFSNTIIIMTTNLGQEYIPVDPSVPVDFNGIQDVLMRRFGSPLFNRIDNVVVFRHLDIFALESIVKHEIYQLNKRLLPQQARVVLSDAVVRDVAEKGLGSCFGGRILNRAVRDSFYPHVTDAILKRGSESPIEISFFMNSEGVPGVPSSSSYVCNVRTLENIT